MTAKAVAVFGSSATKPDSREWADAVTAGSKIAEAGLRVVTGGYGGVMEAASAGAASAGGHVIGVTVPSQFRQRSGANPYVTEELEAKNLTDRIGILTEVACAAIVLPGSIGTAAEMLVAWNINHIARNHGIRRFPTAAVGSTWASLRSLLVENTGASSEDIYLADDIEAALGWLLGQPEIR